jgi:hypothetical protein
VFDQGHLVGVVTPEDLDEGAPSPNAPDVSPAGP